MGFSPSSRNAHAICQKRSSPSPVPTTATVPTTTVQTTTPPLPDCPIGYTRFGQHCYKYFSSSYYWSSSESECKAEGGHLASVHSLEEDQFLRTLTQYDFWLGGYPNKEGDGWNWSDRTEWDYENFYSFSVNEYVYYSSSYNGWYTSNDGTSRHYICKI